MDRSDKIKIILDIIGANDDRVTDYILDIVAFNKIDYTSNKNGMFINISVLSDDILDYIYNVLSTLESTTNIGISDTVRSSSKNTSVLSEPCITKGNDTLLLNSVDMYLLSLSKQVLTI